MKILLRITTITLGLCLILVLAYHLLTFQKPLPKLGPVPPFEFTEKSGQHFGLDQLKGKVSVVNFIFTNCEGPCPMMSSKMALLRNEFQNEGRVQFVSISVDPERDTLEALKEYAGRYQAEEGPWFFLRGPLDGVSNLLLNGFRLSSEELPVMHSTRFVLVDLDGEIRGYHDPLDPKGLTSLVKAINTLLRER